ncbi:MAG: Hint domain-containing homing endonuclease, partial [Nitrosopumilus sp.]
MSKRRVLFIGESSFLATGFSTYLNEVLKRLHETDEFEIAEMGSYGHADDPRCQQVPWKFYPVAPARSDQQAMQKYLGNQPISHFGELIFDKVCLEFKPDIVVSIRDWWMDEFVLRSPLRDHFTFIWMPTIDGEPQRELWLDSYLQTDRILTYSEYGMNLLKKTGRRGTNLVTIASPGADLEIFKPPENKRDHKAKLGIDPNSLIVGCFAKNTPVLMADLAWKNIQDIQINDKVIDADGNEQDVTHIHQFNDDKKMLDITVM